MEKIKRSVLVSPELAKGHELIVETISTTHFVGEATLPPGESSTWSRQQTHHPRISSVDAKRGFLFTENTDDQSHTMLELGKDVPVGITYLNGSVAYSEGSFDAQYAIIESEQPLKTPTHYQYKHPERHAQHAHDLAHYVSEHYPACLPTEAACLQENDILQLTHAEIVKAEGGGTVPENTERWHAKRHLCRVATLYSDAVEVETIPGPHTETNQEMSDKITSKPRRIILGALAVGTPDYARAQDYEQRGMRTHFRTGGDVAVGAQAELTYALHYPTPQHVRDAIGNMTQDNHKRHHFSLFHRDR